MGIIGECFFIFFSNKARMGKRDWKLLEMLLPNNVYGMEGVREKFMANFM